MVGEEEEEEGEKVQESIAGRFVFVCLFVCFVVSNLSLAGQSYRCFSLLNSESVGYRGF